MDKAQPMEPWRGPADLISSTNKYKEKRKMSKTQIKKKKTKLN